MPNKTHTIVSGDTFETISSRYFGEPSQSGRIRAANPGTSDTLVTGSRLLIPSFDEDSLATEAAGLVFRVDGVAFEHATSFTLTRQLDAVDKVEITAPLAETEAFASLITPLSYRRLEVADAGQLMFTGNLVTVNPSLTPAGSVVKLSGYSLPGVLSDCTAPANASNPTSWRNLKLADVARKVIEPFSIRVVEQGDLGGRFRRVKLKRDAKIMSFLASLAQQRQVLIRSDTKGRLVLATPPEVSTPVVSLRQDEPPMLTVEANFAPQKYFSHVTGVRSTRRGNAGSAHTVPNDLAMRLGALRPITISIRDTSRGELPKAVAAAAGRMLANAVTYRVKMPTWHDPSGARWTPGDTVELLAPSVFVQKPYEFQIRAVQFNRAVESADTASLDLMLPGAFGGTPPDMLPWG